MQRTWSGWKFLGLLIAVFFIVLGAATMIFHPSAFEDDGVGSAEFVVELGSAVITLIVLGLVCQWKQVKAYVQTHVFMLILIGLAVLCVFVLMKDPALAMVLFVPLLTCVGVGWLLSGFGGSNG